MKKIIAVVFIGLLSFGCKGKTGSEGPVGPMGPSGHTELIYGQVISDQFTVTDSRFSKAYSISVYLSDGLSGTELPYFLPSKGVNTYYIATPSQNKVVIYNAQTAAATNYVISLSMS